VGDNQGGTFGRQRKKKVKKKNKEHDGGTTERQDGSKRGDKSEKLGTGAKKTPRRPFFRGESGPTPQKMWGKQGGEVFGN